MANLTPNREDWYIGFGWDESLWQPPLVPHRKILDELFPDNPVAFSRVDGHSLWVNTQALKLAGLHDGKHPADPNGGRIERDTDGQPTGLFIDAAKDLIEKHIPSLSRADFKAFLQKGMQVFHRTGFTHIRDVGGCQTHWELASELEASGELNIFCEMLFNLDSFENLSQRLNEIKQSRMEPHRQLRVAGLKLFFDGALGSEGALLSRPYPSGKNGFLLYELSQIEEILRRCWEHQTPVAIHTLGDEAVHQIVSLAHLLKEKGIEGPLHLEHCEVVRPETIVLMKALDIRCHLQPSHFLSDQRWLKAKLGELYKYCFPWRNLIEARIPINFGSDSPIEEPSLLRTQRAIDVAVSEGILAPPVSLWSFHSHHDGTWGNGCVTKLNGDGTVEVHFSHH